MDDYNPLYKNTEFGLTNKIIITVTTPYADRQFSYDNFIALLEAEMRNTPHQLDKHRLLEYEEHLQNINEMFGRGMNKAIFKSIYLQFKNEISDHVVNDMIGFISTKDNSFMTSSYCIPNSEL